MPTVVAMARCISYGKSPIKFCLQEIRQAVESHFLRYENLPLVGMVQHGNKVHFHRETLLEVLTEKPYVERERVGVEVGMRFSISVAISPSSGKSADGIFGDYL